MKTKTLRAIRRENECTVVVIAARARCSPSLVSNLEHGYSPPVWRSKNLADAYGLTVDQFWAAFSAKK